MKRIADHGGDFKNSDVNALMIYGKINIVTGLYNMFIGRVKRKKRLIRNVLNINCTQRFVG